MRSEKEMFGLILDMAENDERVRAVVLSGSRANLQAERDPFQDYDLLFVVTDVDAFVRDRGWIEHFGEIMIMQTPEENDEPPPFNDGRYIYLMQFADGNRIDLHFFPVTKIKELPRESMSKLLLDKDSLFEPFPPPDETDYLPAPPGEKQFTGCCNQFWWVNTYVAKGLWRDELPYVKKLLDGVVRDELMKMLTWHIGIKTGFTISPGQFGRHLEKYLEPELWSSYVQTYAGADPEDIWRALFTMGDLFRRTAREVAEHFGYGYPEGDDQRVTAHLKHIKTLPKNAREMY